MDEQAKRDLRNVIVFALIDGELSEQEKQFIDQLRVRLGVGEPEFRDLCEQVRQNPRQLSLPKDSGEATEAMRLLVDLAMVDGQVSDPERRMLERLAAHVGLDAAAVEQFLTPPPETQDEQIANLTEEIYANFAGWDEPTRRQKVAALAGFGRESVLPLLHVLESYRMPEGATDALELRTLVAEQMGGLGDDRAAYYLAQQVNIGDMDDEITNAALRYVSAEALGRIVGEDFSRDQAGVVAARAWWLAAGSRKYDRLAL
jgi:tellurite resistance protein